MGMIGQTWTFQNGFGAINTFDIQSAPPNAGCRDGDSLVVHMTKATKDTYWQIGAEQAELWFVLNHSPDGSWRSTASLVNMPLGSLFSGPMIISADVIDTQSGMPLPYMIAPPDTSTPDHFVNETRSLATGDPGLSYVCNIPADQPLLGPNDGEYWRTDFYLAQVVTPLYTGPAIVSDQYEGVCGHERWFFAPGLGIVEIESLNDGGQIKGNPVCAEFTQAQFWDPRYTIKRTN
jgi:hypothetical protein